MTRLRAHRVGWPLELSDIEASYRSIEMNAQPCRVPRDVRDQRHHDLDIKFLLALKYLLLEQFSEVREAAREVVLSAEEYFFGEWREILPTGNAGDEPPNPEYFHRYAAWAHELYTGSVLWAMCLEDWECVKRLSDYVTRVCELNIDQSKENRAWLLILAAVLRGESIDGFQEEREQIVSGRSKREKLLLNLLEAILNPDSADLGCATKEYFKYYRQVENKRHSITSKVAIDGSILVHFAERVERPLPIPATMEDYVVRL